MELPKVAVRAPWLPEVVPATERPADPDSMANWSDDAVYMKSRLLRLSVTPPALKFPVRVRFRSSRAPWEQSTSPGVVPLPNVTVSAGYEPMLMLADPDMPNCPFAKLSVNPFVLKLTSDPTSKLLVTVMLNWFTLPLTITSPVTFVPGTCRPVGR